MAPKLPFLPQLLVPSLHPPKEAHYLNEIKWDGYRLIGTVDPRGARLYTRQGNCWTRYFPALEQTLRALPCEEAWLDGELVALNPDGSANFGRLQAAVPARDPSLVYLVFDLVRLDGRDLFFEPIEERKRLLASLLADAPGNLRYVDHLEGEAEALFDLVRIRGVEGIVSKRAGSPYRCGRRSQEWLKVKCVRPRRWKRR